MTQWDDSKKFWMETRRTALFGIIGTVVATLVLSYSGELDKQKISIQGKLIDDFLGTSQRYALSAESACAKPEDEVLREDFEDKTVDEYRSTLRRLRIFFAESVGNKLAASEKLHNELHEAYKSRKSNWRMVLSEFKKADDRLVCAAISSMGLNDNPFTRALKAFQLPTATNHPECVSLDRRFIRK